MAAGFASPNVTHATTGSGLSSAISSLVASMHNSDHAQSTDDLSDPRSFLDEKLLNSESASPIPVLLEILNCNQVPDFQYVDAQLPQSIVQ
jgi:hypothetical protein